MEPISSDKYSLTSIAFHQYVFSYLPHNYKQEIFFLSEEMTKNKNIKRFYQYGRKKSRQRLNSFEYLAVIVLNTKMAPYFPHISLLRKGQRLNWTTERACVLQVCDGVPSSPFRKVKQTYIQPIYFDGFKNPLSNATQKINAFFQAFLHGWLVFYTFIGVWYNLSHWWNSFKLDGN